MRRRLITLISGTLAGWLIVLLPACLLGGNQAAVHSLTATIICLVPTTATLVWACLTWGRSPEQRLLITVGGMAVRVSFVVAAGLLLFQLIPYFHQVSFWGWLAVFYLITLGLETALVRSLGSASPAV